MRLPAPDHLASSHLWFRRDLPPVRLSARRNALGARKLIYSEDNQYQYRFRDIVDLASGRHLFTVEHEVRSATHPMYLRQLINRNPAQTNRNYAHGHDQWLWAMEPDQYDER